GKDFGRNSDKEAVSLLVHICGAVKNPGVYELSEGDRICHAVEKAGGFTTQADQNYLNQAQKVTDGMRIYIPTQEETALETEDILLLTDDLQQAHAGESGLININTAGMEQLCSLPGIGEGKAQNIIAYREEKGSYTSIEEIMNVEGIKEGLFEKIRDKITVS
ncbi:MAG: helix-hairpin-helix domain-containing protein, partial [Lachnospiraceae bacterium]|nr:helix-hairpin-helix domain-containing protein [Lachnospiraceae bacterium]